MLFSYFFSLFRRSLDAGRRIDEPRSDASSGGLTYHYNGAGTASAILHLRLSLHKREPPIFDLSRGSRGARALILVSAEAQENSKTYGGVGWSVKIF